MTDTPLSLDDALAAGAAADAVRAAALANASEADLMDRIAAIYGRTEIAQAALELGPLVGALPDENPLKRGANSLVIMQKALPVAVAAAKAKAAAEAAAKATA